MGVRREAKKAKTRDALIRAAFRLFLDRGYEATTIDDITEAAGVSRRTFFRYFSTKEAVVFPMHQDRVETFRGFLQEEHEKETGFGAIRRASLAMAEIFYARREDLRIQYEIVSANPALMGLEMMLDRRFEEAMVEAVVKREGKSAVTRRRAKLIASATMGMVRTTLRDWYERGAKSNLLKLGEEAFALLEEGFGPRYER